MPINWCQYLAKTRETHLTWKPLSWNSIARWWRQSETSERHWRPEVGNPRLRCMTLQTTNSREKNVTNQSVTPHIIYLFIPHLRINHRSMTWRIFTEWLGGGGVVIVTDCILFKFIYLFFFRVADWQLVDEVRVRVGTQIYLFAKAAF